MNVLEKILEEVEDLVKKNQAQNPMFEGDGCDRDGNIILDEWLCPRCGRRYEVDYDEYDFCPNCGQRIDWSEKENWHERNCF